MSSNVASKIKVDAQLWMMIHIQDSHYNFLNLCSLKKKGLHHINYTIWFWYQTNFVYYKELEFVEVNGVCLQTNLQRLECTSGKQEEEGTDDGRY